MKIEYQVVEKGEAVKTFPDYESTIRYINSIKKTMKLVSMETSWDGHIPSWKIVKFKVEKYELQ